MFLVLPLCKFWEAVWVFSIPFNIPISQLTVHKKYVKNNKMWNTHTVFWCVSHHNRQVQNLLNYVSAMFSNPAISQINCWRVSCCSWIILIQKSYTLVVPHFGVHTPAASIFNQSSPHTLVTLLILLSQINATTSQLLLVGALPFPRLLL